MATFAAAFEIDPASTLSLDHLKRQALTRLIDMIPDGVTITGEWAFKGRTHLGRRFWLIAEAPATGPIDASASAELADMVRTDIPDMAAWIDHALSTSEQVAA